MTSFVIISVAPTYEGEGGGGKNFYSFCLNILKCIVIYVGYQANLFSILREAFCLIKISKGNYMKWSHKKNLTCRNIPIFYIN